MADAVKIIENGLVFTGDRKRRAGRLTLVIRNDRITEVNARSDVVKALNPSAEVIDARTKILLPGFVDAHLHGESAVLRAFTLGLPMTRWPKEAHIQRIEEYLSRSASPEQWAAIYRISYFGALKAGVTTISEFGHDAPDFALNASYESMRRADIRGCIGLHSGEQLDQSKKLRHPSVSFALVMSNEDDLTTYNLQTTYRLARELRIPLLIHLGEQRRGAEVVKKNFRRSVVQLLEEYKIFDWPVQLSHLSTMDPGDMDILARSNIVPIYSPQSMMEKEVDRFPLAELREHGIRIALATDWGTPDPFRTIRAFITLAAQAGSPAPTAGELLEMHTTHPATVLGLGQEVGSIEVGKKADVVFVDASDIRLVPGTALADPERALFSLFSNATPSDVTDVMVNGEFFIRERQILTYAAEDLSREAAGIVQALEHASTQGSLQAPQLNALPQGEPPPEEGDDQKPFEEGFKIVGPRGDAAPEAKIFPIRPERRAPELPKHVKKIFGDEDN
ncbi:MAG TPA: amidohydrolase family protein [Bacteroidota bacterium]|nr:amidohydrolase family protein [Bacteroidota bacterium]